MPETVTFIAFGSDLVCFAAWCKSFHAEVREISILETTEAIGVRLQRVARDAPTRRGLRRPYAVAGEADAVGATRAASR